MTLPVMYRVYDHDDTLVYVGASSRGLTRIQEHVCAHNQRWAVVQRVELEHFDTIEEALDAEARAIREDRPLWNRQVPADGRTKEGRRIRNIVTAVSR